MVNIKKILEYSAIGGAAIGGSYLLYKFITNISTGELPPVPEVPGADETIKPDENDESIPSTELPSQNDLSVQVIDSDTALKRFAVDIQRATNLVKNMGKNEFRLVLGFWCPTKLVSNSGQALCSPTNLWIDNSATWKINNQLLKNLKTHIKWIKDGKRYENTPVFGTTFTKVYALLFFRNKDGKIIPKVVGRYNMLDNSFDLYDKDYTFLKNIFYGTQGYYISRYKDGVIFAYFKDVNGIKTFINSLKQNNKSGMFIIYDHNGNEKLQFTVNNGVASISSTTMLNKNDPLSVLFPNAVYIEKGTELKDYSPLCPCNNNKYAEMYHIKYMQNKNYWDKDVIDEAKRLANKTKHIIGLYTYYKTSKGNIIHIPLNPQKQVSPDKSKATQYPFKYYIHKITRDGKIDLDETEKNGNIKPFNIKGNTLFSTLSGAKDVMWKGYGIFKVYINPFNGIKYWMTKPEYVRPYDFNLTIYKFVNKFDTSWKDVYSDNIKWLDSHILTLKDAKNKVKNYQKQYPDHAFMIYGDPKSNPHEIHLIYTPLNSSGKGALTNDSFGDICNAHYYVYILKNDGTKNWISNTKDKVDDKNWMFSYVYSNIIHNRPDLLKNAKKVVMTGTDKNCKKYYTEYVITNLDLAGCQKYYGFKSSLSNGFKCGSWKLSNCIYKLKQYKGKFGEKIHHYKYTSHCKDSSLNGKIIEDYGYYNWDNGKWINNNSPHYKQINVSSGEHYKIIDIMTGRILKSVYNSSQLRPLLIDRYKYSINFQKPERFWVLDVSKVHSNGFVSIHGKYRLKNKKWVFYRAKFDKKLNKYVYTEKKECPYKVCEIKV